MDSVCRSSHDCASLSPILSTTMLASQSLKSCSFMFLSLVIEKTCLVLGTKATTRLSALQFHLCLHEHPFSPFFQFILLQFFQFFCFCIQFDDSVLNNGIPFIPILCYFLFQSLSILHQASRECAPHASRLTSHTL